MVRLHARVGCLTYAEVIFTPPGHTPGARAHGASRSARPCRLTRRRRRRWRRQVLTEVWQAELVPPCEPDCDAAYGPFPDQPPYGVPLPPPPPAAAATPCARLAARWNSSPAGAPAAGWWDVAWEEVS
jgi:hypothetical protein